MSKGYTTDGKRRSAMTHASRGHKCGFCGKVSFGNGGKVSHARSHVRLDEAVELVKYYATYPPMHSRMFLKPNDPSVPRLLSEGFRSIGTTIETLRRIASTQVDEEGDPADRISAELAGQEGEAT